MAWFKVDDGFYDHPKVLELDMAAVGLWTMAGAYCSRHLTDGHITARQIKVIGGTLKQAEKLVAVGLWRADDAPATRRRFTFNDWRDFQPTRADVSARRQEDADRKRDARARKASHQGKRENVRPDVRADAPRTVRTPSTPPSALPGPARPDPSTYYVSTPPVPPEPSTAIVAANGGAMTRGERRAHELNATARTAAADHVTRRFSVWAGDGIPKRQLDEVTQQVDRLLADGIDEHQIEAGVKAWHESDRIYASQIPGFVGKAAPTREPKVGKPTRKAQSHIDAAEAVIAAMEGHTP